MENFPFGEPVTKVEQFDKSPKKVFVLGVYASAVHARWIDNNGKTLANALAVASEPYIFWKGDCTELILRKIKCPAEAGKLIPANEKFNGPSGNVLDSEFLTPLGLSRNDCWLCDLVPFSMLNIGQVKALERLDFLFNKYKIPRQKMRLANRENRKIDVTRRKEILYEIKESKAEYLITLGNEPIKYFIKYFDPKVKLINNEKFYSQIQNIEINGTPIKLISLVHPRQAGKLGVHSSEWYDIHKKWIRTTAKKIQKELK